MGFNSGFKGLRVYKRSSVVGHADGTSLSLYGSSVKGTWSEGSLAGDPGG